MVTLSRLDCLAVAECGFLVKKLIDPARVIASCAKAQNLELAHRYVVACNYFCLSSTCVSNFECVTVSVHLLIGYLQSLKHSMYSRIAGQS